MRKWGSNWGWFWRYLIGSWVVLAVTGPVWSASGGGLSLPQDPVFAGYQLTNAFGALRFDWPVAVTAPPGESNRLFVVEKTGRIRVLTHLGQAEPTVGVFLDLRGAVDVSDLETGLLGLAFHPGYATNRMFFVFRSLLTTTEGRTNFLHNRLSRFQTSETDPNRADPDSETVLYSQADTVKFHNGGDLHFGPDGYLYVSVGEEYDLWFEAPDRHQSIERNLQGGILRLDVDGRPGNLRPNPHPAVTTNYWVPADNPFVGATVFNGREVDPSRVRTEFWAVGLRNPWRFSFDPETGELYCGDVGDFSFEEINRVEKGGNYGWPYREATMRHPLIGSDPPSGFAGKDPWLFYPRGAASYQGNCVIGGVVYRGTALPELRGNYIFGDYTRGHVWTAQRSTGGVTVSRLTGDTSLSGFGVDPRDGEILVLNVRVGTIKRLVRVEPEVAAVRFPQTLSETGAFADLTTLAPAEGVIPYSINAPFWSDHAYKRRWFSLPPGSAFTFQTNDPWGLPVGAVWVKHFELELVEGVPSSRRRIETRFLVRTQDDFYGVTYRWNGEQTEAELVPSGGLDQPITIRTGAGEVIREQIWRYPSHNECRTCHNASAGLALGFNTAQLNREVDIPEGRTNQLRWMAARGWLQGAPSPEVPLRRLVREDDETQPLLDRVRSYLASNCGSCHHPGSALVNRGEWVARGRVSRDGRYLPVLEPAAGW